MIERPIEPVYEELEHAGLLAPVTLGGPAERSWLDCDLASLAENRLGDSTDPRKLDAARRADWRARATDDPPVLPSARSFERCYWLLEGGEPAGTIALATSTLGGRLVHLSSLYVFPTYRGRGVGSRSLRRLQQALAQHDLGLRLDTNWCWQRTVRFYVGIGMWVHMWKRDLTFRWDPGTPSPRIQVDPHLATLSVAIGHRDIALARAHRRDHTLSLDETAEARALSDDEQMGEASFHASSTLSLCLALHGWPLIQSEEAWQRDHFADAGAPESLAYRITIWEAWNRKHGWIVDTPRIPGLEYPSWDDFEARWERERKELDLLPDPQGMT
jgi:GNAT superfamily N-acetyltransferase